MCSDLNEKGPPKRAFHVCLPWPDTPGHTIPRLTCHDRLAAPEVEKRTLGVTLCAKWPEFKPDATPYELDTSEQGWHCSQQNGDDSLLKYSLLALLISTSAAHSDGFANASAPADICFMENARLYAANSCEPAESIYKALLGKCSAEIRDFGKWFFSTNEYQGLSYDRKQALINEFPSRYEPHVMQAVLDERVRLNKQCGTF